MRLVTRETGTGLVVAEHSADEAALQHALREIDDRYVLQKHPGDVPGGFVFKVFCVVSEDQEAVCVLTWADDHGRPLPLSSGLIEEVKRWRPEARARRGPDADERNRRLEQRREQERREALAAITDEHRAQIERGRVTVGMSTRPRKPSYQRNRHLRGRRS